MFDSSAPRHVLIAGGGLAGLALGIGLRRSGQRVTVLERSTGDRGPASGLVLAPNGMKALASISPDVAQRVRDSGYVAGGRDQSGHSSAFVTSSGSVLAQLSFDGTEASWDAPIVSIRHRTLVGILRDTAEQAGVELQDGVAVEGYTASAEGVILHAGSAIEGDLLVGADGLRSVVRAGLLGDEAPLYCGATAVRGFGPRPPGHRDGFIAYGRGEVLFASPVDDGQLYWVASLAAEEGAWPPRTSAEARAMVLERIGSWAPALRSVVEQSDDGCIITDVYDRDPASTWVGERVVLIGDAAHPMIYTMGQGANVALEDAAVLADLLARTDDVQATLVAFHSARAERAASIAAQSRMMGKIAHVRAWPLCVARNLMMRIMMRTMDMDRQNADVFGWSAPT